MFKLLQLCGLAFIASFAGTLSAAQPVTNGDFETGSLSAWQDASTDGASVRIVQKNTCFSSGDTTGLNIRGNFSALMRSNSEGASNSQAILTSSAFSAGDGFAFIALSESVAKLNKPTVDLIVEILDANNDSVLVSQSINTARAPLNRGCPSEAVKTRFRSHYISTRAYSGNDIKIRFTQNTKIKGSAFFTLIDQVAMFNEGEQPIFHSRPHPQAGISETSWGMPYLDSAGSFDGDRKVQNLSYSWFIDLEKAREFRNPCVGDLSDGNHTAVLYINDGQHALSDVIQFVIDVPETLRTSVTVADPSDDTPFASTGPIAQDPECQTQLQEYEVTINSPDVDINDPFDIEGDDTTTAEEDTSTTTSSNDTNSIAPAFSIGTESSTATTTVAQVNARSTHTSQSAFFNAADNITNSGIRWKPISESNGNLVVLTPSSFPETTAVLIGSDGITIEFGESVGRSNGDRATYRFNRTGSAYPNNIILRIGNTDYQVGNPGIDVR